MLLGRRIDGQFQIDVKRSEKERGAALRMNEQGVFASPTEACALGQFDFHDGRGVAKDPIPKRTNCFADLIGEPLQTASDDFVIIPPERVTGDVGSFSCLKRAPCRFDPIRIIGGVIGAHHHRTDRPWNQFGGTSAAQPMALHIIHRAVHPGIKPGQQTGFGIAKIHVSDADAGEPSIACPFPDGQAQFRKVHTDGFPDSFSRRT